MQDLRQLVRMLLKLMPNSEEHLPEAARRGGGNRMVRPHIEAYLENTLGEAPRPDSNASWKVYLAGKIACNMHNASTNMQIFAPFAR